MEYLEFGTGENCKAGGMYQMSKEYYGDAPPHWMSYVSVDDVDAAKVLKLG
jgi:predicted enzyme related to lactoylglutathione lyase